MTIKPLGKRVLVKVLPEKEEVHNGIVVPDVAKQRKSWGKVLALGVNANSKNTVELPFPCKVGDVVCFPKFAGIDMEDNQKLLQVQDVFAAKV